MYFQRLDFTLAKSKNGKDLLKNTCQAIEIIKYDWIRQRLSLFSGQPALSSS